MVEDVVGQLVAENDGELVVAAQEVEHGESHHHAPAGGEGVDLGRAGEPDPAEAGGDRAEPDLDLAAGPEQAQIGGPLAERRLDLVLRLVGEAPPFLPLRLGRDRGSARQRPSVDREQDVAGDEPGAGGGGIRHHRQHPRAAVEPVAGRHQLAVGRLIFGEMVVEEAGQRVALRAQRRAGEGEAVGDESDPQIVAAQGRRGGRLGRHVRGRRRAGGRLGREEEPHQGGDGEPAQSRAARARFTHGEISPTQE